MNENNKKKTVGYMGNDNNGGIYHNGLPTDFELSSKDGNPVNPKCRPIRKIPVSNEGDED